MTKKDLKNLIKEILRQYLEEMSATGTGASFTPGAGEQYATKYAFGKKGQKSNRGTKVAEKQGYKKVPDNTRFKAKTFDIEKWK